MVKFKETQLIGNTLKVIFIILLIMFTTLYIFIGEVFITGVIICLVFTILSLTLKLDVSVYNDRIEYRLFPFHVSNRVIMFNSVEIIDVITLKHIGVYGFKIKNNWNGSMYFFGGNNVIRIVKKNKRVIMLSTQRMKEVKLVLDVIR